MKEAYFNVIRLFFGERTEVARKNYNAGEPEMSLGDVGTISDIKLKDRNDNKFQVPEATFLTLTDIISEN